MCTGYVYSQIPLFHSQEKAYDKVLSKPLLTMYIAKVSNSGYIQMQGMKYKKLYSSFHIIHIDNNQLGKTLFLSYSVVSRFFTCSERQSGSLGYEQIDADTFAKWVHTSNSFSGPWSLHCKFGHNEIITMNTDSSPFHDRGWTIWNMITALPMAPNPNCGKFHNFQWTIILGGSSNV